MKQQLHQRPRSDKSKSDEHYTPKSLYRKLCILANLTPRLDVAATIRYHLCKYFFTKEDDALKQEWLIKAGTKKTGIFCNPPQSKASKFITKAAEQYNKHNLNIMMLIPIHSTITKAGIQHIWNDSNVEMYPVYPTPKFIFNGEISKFSSRNRYCLCVWRKKV